MRCVDAVVRGGGQPDTLLMLTYDDHVATPVLEYTPDNVQLAHGPRVPLIMFGGRVAAGIDHRWCGHASITKTAMQLLGLPEFGVARVDDDPGLADRVGTTATVTAPPAFGAAIHIPRAPSPRPKPQPPPAPPAGEPVPVPPVVLRDGTTLPPRST